ncbi:MAG: Crp/Fnr family transcriptional regulator [Methylococcales bacterium]
MLGAPMSKLGSEYRILAALSATSRQCLLAYLEPVTFAVSEILYRPGKTTRYLYFPRSGIVSLLRMNGGMDTLEVAMVGNEGMVGVPVFLGVATPCKLAIGRTAGTAMRMGAPAFYRYAHRDEPLQLLGHYTHALLDEISQLSVCHRFHTLDMRFASWRLTTQDRLQSDDFTITQQVIAQRLGVRRAGISIAAQALQRRNLIHYVRGNITILNRRGLEATSCTCYNVIAAQYR